MGTAKGDGYTITPRDLELIVNAINCTRLPFEIGYDKLARRLGYKNAQSAKAAWNALKKKLDKVAEGAPVVPSLTIEPEPMRSVAESSSKAEASGKRKGKEPVVDPASETSDNDSDDKSEEPPPPKPSKRRKQTRPVDNYGDISTAEDHPKTQKSKPKAKESSSKRKDSAPKAKKRRKARISSTWASASESGSESAEEPQMQMPRKKLKREFTQLAVRDKAGPVKAKAQDKSVSTLERESEAFGAREKAFEAFGMRGDEDEDEDEVEPPPAYVKKESDSVGEGKV